VAAGANLEAQDEHQCTPLHLAARLGKEAAVGALVAAGANLEAFVRPPWGRGRGKKAALQCTPLHLAARYGEEAVVQALVAAGANLEAQDEDHRTPLHVAAEGAFFPHGGEVANLVALRALMAARPNLEAKTKGLQYTPLHLAAMRGGKGGEDAVWALVAMGANVKAQDKGQRTPLHYAAVKGEGAAVQTLVTAGANLEAQDEDQRTPLHLVAGSLVELGRQAAERAEAVVRALVTAGANLEAQDKDQYTPLHLAAKRRSGVVFRVLVAAGANLEARDQDQNTPLHAGWGKEMMALWFPERALVEAGANLEAQDQDQATPLQLAA